MSVSARTTGSAPELGSPVVLFKIPAGYDVSADGQRFLALVSLEKADLRDYEVGKTSPMPPASKILTPDEISDVLAYLLSLKGL